MGFDISSSTIGWSVIEIGEDASILYKDSGYFKPIKKGHIFDKLKSVREEILELLKKYNPNEVSIEDIAKFMPKVSSANTIITLAIYNRTVGLAVFDFLKKEPKLYSVMSIRHGLKLTSELPKKEDIPNLVQTLLGVTLPVKYKKNGTIKPELYDEADAVACCLYHAYKITNKLDLLKRSRKKDGSQRSI